MLLISQLLQYKTMSQHGDFDESLHFLMGISKNYPFPLIKERN